MPVPTPALTLEQHRSAVPLFTNTEVTTSRIIHTPSVFARTSLVHLQEVGELTAASPHVSSREKLPSYLLFLVTGGSGTVRYCEEEFSLSAGDCVFIDCRLPYAQESSADLWSLSWIHFDGPTMAAIYEKYRERGGRPVFRSGHFSEYGRLIHRVFEIAASASYTRDMEIAEKLMSVLTLLMEDAWNPEKERAVTAKRVSVGEVKRYLDENYREKVSLLDLEKRFYINRFYLARSFKEQFGMTINNYLSEVRITKAKSLLRFSKESVEEVGRAVGFEELNYFIRAFKKVEGIPPGEYRKRW